MQSGHSKKLSRQPMTPNKQSVKEALPNNPQQTALRIHSLPLITNHRWDMSPFTTSWCVSFLSCWAGVLNEATRWWHGATPQSALWRGLSSPNLLLLSFLSAIPSFAFIPLLLTHSSMWNREGYASRLFRFTYTFLSISKPASLPLHIVSLAICLIILSHLCN